jgi:ribosomal protein RSM22 (predicted rRNA methylase)
MQMPAELQAAIEAELGGIAPRQLTNAVRELSRRYRAGHGRTWGAPAPSDEDVAAYVAYRLPATFAAIGAVFEEVCDRLPDFRPSSLLDIGAGPGTAAWAAVEVWPDLERVIAVERDVRMSRMGRALSIHSSSAAIRDAAWQEVDAATPGDDPAADVTIAAYVLGELREEVGAEVVRRLWGASAGVCVLVEPGTPCGYALIREAGERLAAVGAHIIAPFPLDWPCLESADDWCHFAARVARTRTHRLAKGASLPYEDEKYAYVVAARMSGPPIAARVIRHPQVRPGHIRLALCTAQGARHVVVTRSNRAGFRRARDLRWGDAILPGDISAFGDILT